MLGTFRDSSVFGNNLLPVEACTRYLYIKGKLHDLHVQKVTLLYINRLCDPFIQQAVLGEHLNLTLLIGNA